MAINLKKWVCPDFAFNERHFPSNSYSNYWTQLAKT